MMYSLYIYISLKSATFWLSPIQRLTRVTFVMILKNNALPSALDPCRPARKARSTMPVQPIIFSLLGILTQ